MGETLGNSAIIKRFMKGVFEKRPPAPRYSFVWDVNIVLNFLENFCSQDIPLSYLTLKLVMLLALATAQRAQTLHLLNVKNFIFRGDTIIIPFSDLLKQSNVKNYKFSLRLLRNLDCPNICVVDCLNEYLERTKIIRGTETQLLISFHKPHKAVSRNTVSRWIKTVLRESGIDVDTFKAHSTRAASCSNAKKNLVSIDEIMKTAGWANAKTFSKYYDKIIFN